MTSRTATHIASIGKEVDKLYVMAKEARSKGFDPVNDVETAQAISLAEKSVGLISVKYPQLQDKRIVNRILELEKEYGQLTMSVSLGIAEDIAKEKYCKFNSLIEAIDAGIRVGFAYTTLGVVSSPLEGFTELKLGKTRDGKEYFQVYFSGPIRSAGTTASCVVLMIIDYLRETFGFAKYDPDENEIKRYITENYDYHDWVTNLQYLPSETEIEFLASRMPIQICGEPTERREVSNFKDLPRVDTDFIRGGMCLIFSEGLAQKAQKGLRLLKAAQKNGYKTTGWDFLDEYLELKKKETKASSSGGGGVPVYIKDIVAGRPVYGHPGASGGFRFRYGRAPTGGFSATSVHPATMILTDSFISYGTQLKIEKPTKGTAVSMCDSIDGPIVKLHDGSVRYVGSAKEAEGLYKDIAEIIYIGDILVSFDDVSNRNYDLIKPGYVEEWWGKELTKAAQEKGETLSIDPWNVSFLEALDYSKRFGIPLHPTYIYYWSQITNKQFLALLDWLARAHVTEGKLVLPYSTQEKERFTTAKRGLELLGVPHSVTLENVVITEALAEPFLYNLGLSEINGSLESSVDSLLTHISKESEDILSIIQSLCSSHIKDKAGEFIGSRMGRPEKAKLRKLAGSPHVLFPVGAEGGRLRSVQAAAEVGHIRSDFPLNYCVACEKRTVYPQCEQCGTTCEKEYYCYQCQQTYPHATCPTHETKLQPYMAQKIDAKHYFDHAKKLTGIRIEELPTAVKGVRGTSNEDHSCEHMAKGLLRAKYNLHVNKDGTIRYDMTEMPLSHFRPVEIGTSIAKLKALGYEKDVHGKPLEHEDQLIELLPHDIVLPSCETSGDEKADETFLKVSQFVDDELEILYGLPRYYNAKTPDDLIGSLFGCIAPHICVAVVGRLIGFSKTQALLASQFMHAAMRRDCDGDEAAVIFLGDLLLNFSRKFLPAHRGGTQDSPLVLVSKINAGEVDDQILDMVTGEYPLELYELAEQKKHSSEVHIENVADRLKEGKDPFINVAYTHPCSNFNFGVTNSSYKSLPTMDEKVGSQMNLCVKLRAVDTSDVARLMIERHFIRDTRGNLRKFSMQTFRCVTCNSKYRRPPLAGKCTSCGGKLLFTISEGSIVKYLDKALNLAHTYGVSDYLKECLDLVQRDVDSIFGKEKEKQEALSKWF